MSKSVSLVGKVLAGTFIANLLNVSRSKTQKGWHVVVYEKGEVKEE